MKTFNVTKKNRKYFAATLNGYKCRILIDDSSTNLGLGEQTLQVDDISVRSKFGTDLIFKLSASSEEQKEAGVCTLRAAKNLTLISRCKELGGKWDPETEAWIFSTIVEDEVDELDEYYNSPLVPVEITITEEEWGAYKGPLHVAGFEVARAYGRDSGATVAQEVAVLKGGFRSSGSAKNWYTVALEGTVLRMQIPQAALSDIEGNESYEVRPLSKS